MPEGQAIELLQGILARAEFASARGGRSLFEIWTSAIRDWIWDLLLGLARPVGDALTPRRNWIELAILVAAVAVLVFIGWVIWRAVNLGMVREARSEVRAAVERRLRSDALWREARDLAARGRLGDATRALYLSALYALEERAVLSIHEALTNREHAERVLAEQPELNAVFATVVQRYDRLRYGASEVDRAAFNDLSDLVQRARALTE